MATSRVNPLVPAASTFERINVEGLATMNSAVVTGDLKAGAFLVIDDSDGHTYQVVSKNGIIGLKQIS